MNVKDLGQVAMRGWAGAEDAGETDYDKLWQAAAEAVLRADRTVGYSITFAFDEEGNGPLMIYSGLGIDLNVKTSAAIRRALDEISDALEAREDESD